MEVYHMDGDGSSADVCSRWFKMPSRLWDTEVGGDPYLVQLLAYLCDRARISEGPVSFGDGKGRRNFYLAAGEAIVGRHQAARDLKCAPSTVRNRLQKLMDIGLVRCKPSKNFTVVTIVFSVQESTKKKRPKKDNRKTTVDPSNSLADERNGSEKRTDEGQLKNDGLPSEFIGEPSSTVIEKGQMKDRRRTDDGQMMDTNKKDKKIRRKEGEREIPSLSEIESFQFSEYQALPDDERQRLAFEIFDALTTGKADSSNWQALLRQWTRATKARLKKERAFKFDFEPSTTSTASTPPPQADRPKDLEEAKAFFAQEGFVLPADEWFSFLDGRSWTRLSGSLVDDWKLQARIDNEMHIERNRAKAESSSASPSPSTPPPPLVAPPPSVPNRVVPAKEKTFEEFNAELQRATS
jgi:hypothetical protein